MGQAITDGVSEIMNVIVQMDKEEYDTLHKQASQNMQSMTKIAVDVAYSTLDDLVKALNSPENIGKAKTMGELADFLVKSRTKFAFVVMDAVQKDLDYSPPFVPMKPNA